MPQDKSQEKALVKTSTPGTLVQSVHVNALPWPFQFLLPSAYITSPWFFKGYITHVCRSADLTWRKRICQNLTHQPNPHIKIKPGIRTKIITCTTTCPTFRLFLGEKEWKKTTPDKSGPTSPFCHVNRPTKPKRTLKAAEDLVVFNQVEVKIDENHFRKGVENWNHHLVKARFL